MSRAIVLHMYNLHMACMVYTVYAHAPFLTFSFVFSYRCDESNERQERTSRTLVNVKSGIEHLADKLQHLKAVKTATL